MTSDKAEIDVLCFKIDQFYKALLGVYFFL